MRNFNLSVSGSKRFVWYRVAKTGTRSLTSVFEEQFDDYLYFGHIKSEVRQLSKRFLKPDYFHFTIVRNPWDRLVSAWRNRVRPDENGVVYSVMEKTIPNSQLIELQSSFQKFVKFLREHPLSKYDVHFSAQYSRIDLDRIDYIGRFEEYEKSVRFICDRLGLSVAEELPRLNQSATDQPYSDYYDDETRSIVAEMYKTDIQLFNYTFD